MYCRPSSSACARLSAQYMKDWILAVVGGSPAAVRTELYRAISFGYSSRARITANSGQTPDAAARSSELGLIHALYIRAPRSGDFGRGCVVISGILWNCPSND